MLVVKTISELQEALRDARSTNKTVGLVPTMGALHEGHVSLIKKSIDDNDVTVVSLFVNPTQFNNAHDLATYPRTEKEDLEKLKNANVDIAFVPAIEEVYPEPDTRVFDLGDVAEVMEGAMRPGHFNGVAQIVSKLFDWVKPDNSYFGEKDFQQIAVIRRMNELIGNKTNITPCPIVREDDGLAMSSRNKRLTEAERVVAPEIYRTLKLSKEWKGKGLSPTEIIEKVVNELDSKEHLKTEYFQIVDSNTLQPIKAWDDVTENAYPIGCIAIYCGDVRLIDNIKY